MPLRIRDHLHWCDCSGRAIFLDVEADRYFCLPSAPNDAFLRLAAGDTRDSDLKALQALVSRGLLVEDGARTAFAAAQIEPPAGDLLSDAAPRPGLLRILAALAAERRAARLLQTRPFAQVIERAAAGSKRVNLKCEESPTLHAIVAAFNAVSYLTRDHNRCLVRALAVRATCNAAGIRPKLVFGVTAHPFAAHCWVQHGGTVLVGGLEQARLHTPILVVE